MILLFGFMPIAVIYATSRPFKTIQHDKNFKVRWAPWFRNIKLDDRKKTSYFPVFMLRRILFVLIAFCLFNYPYLQVIFFLSMNLVCIAHTGYYMPFDYRNYNYLVILNEYFIIVIVCHLVCFTDFVPDLETQSQCGWSVCFLIAVCIIVNLLGIIYIVIYGLYLCIVKLCIYAL